MNKARALALVFAGGVLFEAVAILGLAAMGVNEATLSLGLIVPLVLTSYLSSCVVMRYGASGRQRR